MNLRTLASLATLTSLTSLTSLSVVACGGSVVRSLGDAGGADAGGGDPGGASVGGSSQGGAGGGGLGGQGGEPAQGGAGGAGGVGGEGLGGAGGALMGCEQLTHFALSDAKVTPVDGPTWQPGEGLAVEVMITNLGPDYFDYPGIRVSSSHLTVTEATAENWFFGMFAGQSEPLGVVFQAAPDAVPGTTVTFTVTMSSLALPDCEGAPTLDVSATLEP